MINHGSAPLYGLLVHVEVHTLEIQLQPRSSKISFRALNSSLTPYNNTKPISFVQWVSFERAEMEPVSPAITDRFVTMPTPPLSKLKALHNRAWSKEKLTHSVTGSNRDETCFTRRQFCHNPSPPPLNSKASATEPWAKQENQWITEKLEMIYLVVGFETRWHLLLAEWFVCHRRRCRIWRRCATEPSAKRSKHIR